jgi:quinol monooxygenase YgiN
VACGREPKPSTRSSGFASSTSSDRDANPCLHHSVHRDVEDPFRAVFLEHWVDRASLAAHFSVPASLEFVTAVSALAAEPPVLDVYEAERIDIAELR